MNDQINQPETSETQSNMFDNCVVFTLSMHAWRVHRKVKDSEASVFADVAIGEESEGKPKAIDRKFATVTKKLLHDCKEYKAILTLDGAIRKQLTDLSVPNPVVRPGSFLLSFASVPKVQGLIEDYKTNREQAVATFVGVYPEIVKELARKSQSGEAMGGLFRSRDYPSPEALSEKFSIESGYEAFGTAPEALKRISEDLFANEQAKVDLVIRDSVGQVQNALRSALLQLVGHLQDRLTDKDDGKRKVLRDSAITNLTEWLSLFKDRNVTNDVGLEGLVGRAQKILDGVDPDDLRKSADLRTTIASRLNDVGEKLADMVEDAPVREFDWAAEIADEVTDEAEAMAMPPEPEDEATQMPAEPV